MYEAKRQTKHGLDDAESVDGFLILRDEDQALSLRIVNSAVESMRYRVPVCGGVNVASRA